MEPLAIIPLRARRLLEGPSMSVIASKIDFQKTTANVEYRIAATRQERADAFRLVYDSYLRAGLGEPNPYGLRVTPYHLLPTTEVFIATLHGQVICTMTLVIDGELGLPIEEVYGDNVAALRHQGLLLGEVSCLADRRASSRELFPVFWRLSGMVVQYSQRRGVDALVVACHPKHARFYQRTMDFRPLGEQRDYPTVRNRPAMAVWLEFARAEAEGSEKFRLLVGSPYPWRDLEPRPIHDADRTFFGRMVDPVFEMVPVGAFSNLQNQGQDTPAIGAA